jgi:hypothetical protein
MQEYVAPGAENGRRRRKTNFHESSCRHRTASFAPVMRQADCGQNCVEEGAGNPYFTVSTADVLLSPLLQVAVTVSRSSSMACTL